MVLFFAGLQVDAQIKTPAPSPKSTLSQVVGLTDVTVEYSRPSMKDRTIFGELVPFGEMWRAGANKNTMIEFSEDVKINGSDLKKGNYAVFIKPMKDSWEFNFYTDTENWGVPEDWSADKVALTTTSKVMEMPMPMETYTIDVGDLTNNGAVISFLWEKAWVPLQLEVGTDAAVSKTIDKAMAGPDWYEYYQSARYYLESGKDLNKALEWINISTEGTGGEKFWVMRQKGLIQGKLGQYKDAIKTLEKSTELAVTADNKDYQRMNTKTIAEFKAMK